MPQVDEKQPDFSLTFRHKVRDGATPHTHYGSSAFQPLSHS